ncbi:hypothetical protein KGY71_07475 [Candidatus Bipolaricaulota bacterium]|nr:hypothetical protein [Candidatus Bipolaricaulota bacterium]
MRVKAERIEKYEVLALVLVLTASLLTVNAYGYKLDIGQGNQGQEWSVTLDAEDLISEGALVNKVTSDSDQVLLSVNPQNDSSNWKVTVKREDDNWPSGLKLYIKRTGSGNGQGSLAGGLDSYFLVETTEKVFFTGESQGMNNIPVQFQLKGLGAVLSMQNFSTDISTKLLYTVTKN